jgi:hypothetical protein
VASRAAAEVAAEVVEEAHGDASSVDVLRTNPGACTMDFVQDEDVEVMLNALFDVRADTQEILRLLGEEDDEEETTEEP